MLFDFVWVLCFWVLCFLLVGVYVVTLFFLNLARLGGERVRFVSMYMCGGKNLYVYSEGLRVCML